MPAEIKIWDILDVLDHTATEINLIHVIDQISRIRDLLSKNHTPLEFQTELDALQKRLEDELRRKWFYYIDSNKVKLYQNPIPSFGQEVFDKFESANHDIDEAVKCYALGRNAATVFHCMRSLEAGLKAIARSLGIPEPIKGVEKNWGEILKKIENGIKSKWPTAASEMDKDCSLFQNMFAGISALKKPRNSTMHLEGKYDESEAKYYLDVIGGFMKMVASRMDENGLPKA